MKHHNKITPAQPGHDPGLDQTVLSRLAALKAMSVKELKAEWEKLIGTSAPNNSRRTHPRQGGSIAQARHLDGGLCAAGL